MAKVKTRLIPGIFTKEEHDAALALQDRGVPHPRIEDDAWAKVEAAWSQLPQVWGRGPWLDRNEHSAVARTMSDLHASLYRVTSERWGLELWGTPTGSGVHRGTLEELIEKVVHEWPPPPAAEVAAMAVAATASAASVEVVEAPAAPSPPRHDGARAGVDWLEAPSVGPVVFAGLDGFQGCCEVGWEASDDSIALTAAQQQAARALVTQGQAICAELLDALFRDQRSSAEDEDFPKARSPSGILEHVELRQIYILREERAGLAYTDFSFNDAWRVEHGLAAVMHGTRVVDVGGYGDTRAAARLDDPKTEPEGGSKRNADGSLRASVWVEEPHDAVVELPMWRGLRGLWDVRFVYEDEDELEVTAEQQRAAQLLLEKGDAIREALLARLFESYRKSATASPKVRTLADLGSIIEARTLRIHAEACDRVAYTELVVRAPWRRLERARVLMNGARVVALTTKAKVESAIETDQDARLRAKRARKKRKVQASQRPRRR